MSPSSAKRKSTKASVASLDRLQRQAVLDCDAIRARLKDDPAAAVEMAQRVAAALEGTALHREHALALRHAGVGWYVMGGHLLAARHFDDALNLARQAGDRDIESSCLNGLAATFHGLGDLEGSLKTLEEVLTLSQQDRNADANAAALINIGNLHQDLGSHDFAIHAYTQVLATAPLSDDFRATALNNRANALRAIGRLDESMHAHQEALQLARNAELLQREPMILGNLAECLLDAGDAAAAAALLKEALALAASRSLARDEGQLHRKLGIALARTGDRSAASEHLQVARALSIQAGNQREERDVVEAMLELADDDERASPLVATYQELLQMDKQLQHSDAQRRMHAVAVRLQLEQTRHEAAENERRAAELRTLNDKLQASNRSLKLTVGALGVDVDRPRARRGAADEALTAREMQVLKLVAKGLSNETIGRSLGLSRLTIRHYVSCILRKMGAASRTQAVALASQKGLL